MKQLKLYGYSSSGNRRLLKLREVTLLAESKQIRTLCQFLARCAEEMKTNPEWEHQHFAGGGSAHNHFYQDVRGEIADVLDLLERSRHIVVESDDTTNITASGSEQIHP